MCVDILSIVPLFGIEILRVYGVLLSDYHFRSVMYTSSPSNYQLVSEWG